jgi:hypothetical protein
VGTVQTAECTERGTDERNHQSLLYSMGNVGIMY